MMALPSRGATPSACADSPALLWRRSLACGRACPPDSLVPPRLWPSLRRRQPSLPPVLASLRSRHTSPAGFGHVPLRGSRGGFARLPARRHPGARLPVRPSTGVLPPVTPLAPAAPPFRVRCLAVALVAPAATPTWPSALRRLRRLVSSPSRLAAPSLLPAGFGHVPLRGCRGGRGGPPRAVWPAPRPLSAAPRPGDCPLARPVACALPCLH